MMKVEKVRKEKVRKEYLRRVKAAGSQLYAGRLLQAVNAVSVARYTAGILNWTEKESYR